MLYELSSMDGKLNNLEAVPFKDFSSLGYREKDLEELIAKHLFTVLFEEYRMMPIFQQRQYQAEADIYALNEKGELIIFELKRGTADEGAVQQVLRYGQDSGQWSYTELEHKYQQYAQTDIDLTRAHQQAFGLEHAVSSKEMNSGQHLFVIGSAADDSLSNAVDYWKQQGISIEFLPYRIYELGGSKYFEFFALPYDRHTNPGASKGVLFDTNRSWDEDAIWYMMENSRVAAFGDASRFIQYISPGDIVFFSHRWAGLVAAAKVLQGSIKSADGDILYRDVDFITRTPTKGESIKAMPFKQIVEITGKNYFWTRTVKTPYLSKDEADNLAGALKLYLETSGV